MSFSHQHPTSKAPKTSSPPATAKAQRQLTSKTSSSTSDHEITSLYGKYSESACSINKPIDHKDSPRHDRSLDHAKSSC
ncbi:hypothetical protein PtA15_5A459 [Puccinia triticina]|uniref:Uncharacterized protein n=1 Tax=Puccinia triticina TaxID=208348 RepID=A0ABY7CI31_9BASI|nr:uncharacterized protein PtA15_5A459 [Puccinia triticina]WAQ84886.1 hypothetical protein PtA15_5A459 [Puccinia triticina]